jgi:hypothetical protein
LTTILSRLPNDNNNNSFVVKTSKKNYLYISFCEKKDLCICKGNEKIPFHFPTKEEIARTAFFEKKNRNYSSSLQISLSDLSNKDL